ncbi:MAG TPA: PD-(D/E)XK nuclease family protein [Candidatus Aquilonibacter sp.]|nr:PD-(D/E)XK nuclease family protein [Candidatus Aquilonibacter sp.]
MQARFLLGPAGSGKTFRCLAEIRAALKENSEGAPLIFLAPKQATFQLERQLLADAGLNGFTRLHILSFERLARFIFEKLNVAPPPLLSDEGRVMVLRALLLRHEGELKLFSRSARRPGFAQQLSQLLRELQQHQIAPAKLRVLAQNKNLRAELRDKLADLALLHENYSGWLAENELQDANRLLDVATEALKKSVKCEVRSAGAAVTSHFPLLASHLFLDGFAEMTPQELDLLAAIVPFCENATLAFCLESEPKAETSWLSIWNAVGKTFQQCRQRIENLPDCKIEIEILPRDSKKNRFAKDSELAHLEKFWTQPPSEKLKAQSSKLKIVRCANPDAKAVFAAREILRFVRAGNRFRDCAILVRNLDNYHKPLAREFRRYGIPFFLDRREGVAHHPLAELTRGTLRLAAFDWRHDDLFAALKAGFCNVEETEIDALENAALEFGWRGKKWLAPLPDGRFENQRKEILPPFENFHGWLSRLKMQPNGKQLAEIFRELWDDLKVEQRLENWSEETSASTLQRFNASAHAAVFEQMNSLLDSLELGFANEALPLRDWLPVLESGLANLSVGVIPPVLDEVLIGAIDRARNPDLKFALVLGVNESVFPATPVAPAILTEADRDELQIPLGPDLRGQLSRERFYGYLACTRASEKLTLTFSRSDTDGNILNPSPFIAQLQNIFPSLQVEEFQSEIDLAEIENANELIPLLPEIKNWGDLLEIPAVAELKKALDELREPDSEENLSPQMAEQLYGPVLRTSVSRLEEFAQCPFRFFVRCGLKAEERKIFELDARERGSFQHDVLKKFHEQVTGEGKRWRDLTPAEARARIGKIAGELTENYRGGLLSETAQSRFAARALTESLQDFVAVTVAWLREQNEFDPVAAELDFGAKESPETAWEIDLAGGRKLALNGRIDRVDLCRSSRTATDEAAAIVIDYKSSQKKLDAILIEHGIQLQLLAYLNVLRRWKKPLEIFGVKELIPAGVFYVNLRGQFENGGSRDEVLANADKSRRAAYRHAGRFDAGALNKLDSIGAADQFNYRLNADGSLRKGSIEALPRAEFEKLVNGVETQLREFGGAIFSGIADVNPYRKGKQTPCEYCDYAAACRIDKWTHKFRVLRAAKEI